LTDRSVVERSSERTAFAKGVYGLGQGRRDAGRACGVSLDLASPFAARRGLFLAFSEVQAVGGSFERTTNGQQRLMIPIVSRDDYLSALRAML
jgi:hypothetical protein